MSTRAERRENLKALVDHKSFDWFILAIIVVNAIVLGFMTSPIMIVKYNTLLWSIDHACLAIFVIEMILKIKAHHGAFFKDHWNIFDFVIVLLSVVAFAKESNMIFVTNISMIPDVESFIVLRTFRVFRALRLLTEFHSLKNVTSTLSKAVPSIVATLLIMCIVFYVFAVISVNLFGQFVAFSTLNAAFLSLFQVLTLDNWVNDIAKPAMQIYPYAWIFFVSFILFGTFLVLNLVVSILDTKMKKQFTAKALTLDEIALKIDELKKLVEETNKK